ncbi:MAG: ribonuclease P protein component [Armatimonadota bacterium]
MDQAHGSDSGEAAPTRLPTRPRIGPLHKQGDFSRIYKQGRRYRTGLLTLVAAPGTGETSALRVSFVVSKKVSKLAVRRNLIRRRLREAFRLLLEPQAPPLDLIVIAHREAAEADYWQLHAALAQAMQRLGIASAVQGR